MVAGRNRDARRGAVEEDRGVGMICGHQVAQQVGRAEARHLGGSGLGRTTTLRHAHHMPDLGVEAVPRLLGGERGGDGHRRLVGVVVGVLLFRETSTNFRQQTLHIGELRGVFELFHRWLPRAGVSARLPDKLREKSIFF